MIMFDKTVYDKMITTLLLFLFVFQTVIEDYLYGGFKYFDEVVMIMALVWAIYRIVKTKCIDKEDVIFIILVILFLLWGWVCTIRYQVQPLANSIQGSFLQSKWFILFWGMKVVFKANFKADEIIENMILANRHIGVIFSIYIFCSLLLSKFCDINYTFRAHDICGKGVLILAILMIDEDIGLRKKMIEILVVISILLTFRAKGYAAVAIFVLISIYVIKLGRQIGISQIMIAMATCSVFASYKIYFYYIRGAGIYARSFMTYKSIEITQYIFPWGYGWGTYGSYPSVEPYSPVYILHGLSEHIEVGIKNRKFLCDVYWPSVLVETGVIGCMLVIGLLVLLYLFVRKMYVINKKYYAASALIIAYMIITTVEETGFMQPVLMPLAMLLGVVCANKNNGELLEKAE